MTQASIQKLLEKGLYHYGLGEVSTAVEIWREVLRLDPDNETAREYIEIETGRKPELEASGAEEEEILEPDGEVLSPLSEAPALAEEFVSGQHMLQIENWEGAIKAFEAAHRFDPQNPIYWAHVDLSRARLIKSVIERLGGFKAAVRLGISINELIGRKDYTQEEGFVISLISGDMTLQDVISLSPIPRYHTYRILHRLIEEGLLKGEGTGN